MKREIRKLLEKAILELKKEEKLDFDLPKIYPVKSSTCRGAKQFNWVEVDYPKNESFGDYSTNIAMILAGKLKRTPIEIAEKLSSVISQIIAGDFSKIEAVKPGYINFHLSKKYLQEKVEEVNNLGEKYGNSKISKGIKVNNEFISANPTGPLHLGNGRGGFYGDTLSSVLKKSGYDVTKEYYVNNAGEQTIKFAHSFKKDEKAVYSGGYIDELREKKRELIDEPVEVSAPPLADAVMEDFIKPAIEKMEIKNVNYVWEDDLYDKNYIEKALKILKDKKLTYEKDDALWFKSTDFGDDKDRVLVKKDGNNTYLASDCGYILSKKERGFDKIIEIWGADHHGYISRFRAVAEALGFKKEDVKFIIVQLVKLVKNGKEVRMSKREGNVVYISELINEVGLDASRFFFLMYSSDTHMTFDLDLAKEKSEKNPVYYVQYAHARVCSILRKAKDIKKADLSLLIHEKEINLIRELNKFPELIEEIAESCEVHRLPYYAIKLADKFHSFYNDCRVIDEENQGLTGARLELIKAVRIVLAETLRLMGVSAPSKM